MIFFLAVIAFFCLIYGVFIGGAEDSKSAKNKTAFVVHFVVFYTIGQWGTGRLALIDLWLLLTIVISCLVGAAIGRLIQHYYRKTNHQ